MQNEMDNLPALPDQDVKAGVLPTEIRKLVESRQQVKQMMKKADLPADLRLQVCQELQKQPALEDSYCITLSNWRKKAFRVVLNILYRKQPAYICIPL